MDFYRHKIHHFAWTWLENKLCPYHRPRGGARHDRTATKLARAFARREVRREIEVSR